MFVVFLQNSILAKIVSRMDKNHFINHTLTRKTDNDKMKMTNINLDDIMFLGGINMVNVYEYGSQSTQNIPNYVYQSFDELVKNSDVVGIPPEEGKKRAKITGTIVAEVFRKNIEYVLKKNNMTNMYKVSENNVYVKGCNIEFDFLILKKSAAKIISNHIFDSNITIELPIYDINDVVAVLESKTYGIYSLYKGRTENTVNEMKKNDLFRFASAYKNTLHGMEKNIKIGYMCLVEQRPNSGKSNFIEKTIYFFEDYFGQNYTQTDKVWYTYFSKCHFTSKTSDIYATDYIWEEFVMNLVQ